jgi:hypothetical protein
MANILKTKGGVQYEYSLENVEDVEDVKFKVETLGGTLNFEVIISM